MKPPATTPFPGFRFPTTTPIPDELFDDLMADLTGAELKVLLYICRRTFGFKKASDTISLNQIASGIVTKEGRVLDHGTGLSKRHVQRALKSLEAKNAVCVQRQVEPDGQNEINTYTLHFLEGVGTKSPYGRDMGVPTVGTPMSTTINSKQETVDKTVDGADSIFHKLPRLKQPKDKSNYIAESIMKQLKDTHSQRFYNLVAARVPEHIIREALAEIKADGADEPPKLFTYKMKLYAVKKLKKELVENGK